MSEMASNTQGELPSSEQLMDEEIQHLREEMQRLKKQRELLQLRNEVAREKQLLNEAQQSLGLSPSSAGADGKQYTTGLISVNIDSNDHADSNSQLNGTGVSQPLTGPSRGIKRRCSESSEGREIRCNTMRTPNRQENPRLRASHQKDSNGDSNEANNGSINGEDQADGEDEVPPTFAATERYRLANRKEYNTLIRFLNHYFSQFPRYFASDHRKVSEALRHIIPSLVNTYNQLVAHGSIDQTWVQLCDFLQTRIKNKTDPESARRSYYHSAQRQNQTVRDFARHLEVSEANLDELLLNDQRIRDLWDRILPEVRDKALPHQYQSNSYQDHVSHLQAIEMSIPSRVHLQRRTPRRNTAAR